ncbi:thioredoxin-disulfide reductase [bacterium]|nr:thioredoxin-disulfide reductase [bacterium]NCQ55320.1 thioredoxin-disulfide reductase [Candidatus Parcubacteria bacterium]NCS67167.1 thioredoxin-disulfide reductase [Candidatus Peregrinibacteria bacterium]NCS96793.1 thioredoxin-disulfide reductase [bacterium]
MNTEKLVILGSGPAGLTAAIYAARADLAPLVLEGPHPGGQLMTTTDVENFPGFPEGIMGPQLIDNMRKQAERFGARCQMKAVTKVNFSDPKCLKLDLDGTEITADSVIIATGSSARWLNLGRGEEKYWGKGYTACATCDGAFFRGKTVAIVGGGDSACEEATFLTKFADKVYLVHRRKELRASKPMQKRVFENKKIEMIWNQNVTELRGEPTLKSVELTDTDTGAKSELEIDGLFMGIGHDPATKFLDDSIELENGYIKVTNQTGTSVPSVFVGGDVADWHYQQAITAAGFGCKAALDAEAYLTSLEH